MNITQMENQSLGENIVKYKNLHDLLQSCKTNKNTSPNKKPTNTRIGSKDPTIDKKYPGSYHIPKDMLDNFHELLENKRKKGQAEHMTEIQDRKKGGPLLFDFDFRYLQNTKDRKFDDNHINDIVELICIAINKVCETEKIEPFPLFVFTKKNVNDIGDCVKDGIHMIGGIRLKHGVQMVIRDMLLKSIGNVLYDMRKFLCPENTPDKIIDEGISKGEVGWQMYGSSKPGHEAYELTKCYSIRYTQKEDSDMEMDSDEEEIDEEDDGGPLDFDITPKEVSEWYGNNLVSLFSLKRKAWQKVPIREKYKNLCKEIIKQKTTQTKQAKQRMIHATLDVETLFQDLRNIKNIGEIDNLIERMINSTEIQNYDIVTAHELVMLLDSNYYDPYDKWMKTGWALHNVSDMNILSFIKFSSKSDKFDINSIDEIIDVWEKMRDDGLTIASLRYWAKQCNPTEYEQLYKTNVSMFLEEVIQSEGSDWDLAMLAHHLYGDKIKCIDAGGQGMWKVFSRGRWKNDRNGMTLRKHLSLKLSRIFIMKEKQIVDDLRDSSWSGDAEKQAELTSLTNTYNKIAIKLKRSSDKNNILNEAKALFYDETLVEKLDSNAYLIGFKNGIYDFEGNEFREGRPDDYVSKTTKLDYIDCRKPGFEEGIAWLNDFMEKIFPDPNLRAYMWEHAATGLIGNNKNQTFNIYTGCGRNGKSKFVDLMRFGIGEYYGKVPTQLITQKRTSIGGTSSEVAQLKGIRYAVMTEPSKNDTINEGIMKEITGEDEIQARHLRQEAIVFVPQFTLCCMTNYLFNIKSNDDGTWRRIRKIDFESKFMKPSDRDYPPSKVPEDKEFECDLNIEPKLRKWAPVWISLLCEIAVKKLGHVTDCSKVIAASNAYRGAEDYCHLFFEDMVEEVPPNESKDDYILHKNKAARYFKDWYQENYGAGIPIPPVKEIVQYFERKMGKLKRGGHMPHHWVGFRWIQKNNNQDLGWMGNDD